MSSVQKKPFVPPFFTKYGQFTKGPPHHHRAFHKRCSLVSPPPPLLTVAAVPSPPPSPSPLSDALTKKFEYRHKLVTIATHRNGLRIESGAILQDGGAAVGYVKSRFPAFDYGTLTTELYTDASQESKAEFVAKGLPVGMTVAGTLSSKDKDKAFKGPVDTVDVTYRREFVAATLKGKTDLSTHKVDASLSLGSAGISVGGLVSVDASNGADVTEMNVGAEYEQDDYLASMYTEKNLAYLTAAYFQRLTPSHILAATFSYNIHTRAERKLTVGNEYRVDADTTVKSRVEIPTGDVSTHVEHRLANPRLLLGVSSRFNLKSQKLAMDQLGVGVTLGEF